MEQTNFGSTSKTTKLQALSKEQLIERNTVLEFEVGELVKELYRLRSQRITDEQLQLIAAEQIESLTSTIYGKKSERYKKSAKNDDDDGAKKPGKPRIKRLSERYPNIPINELFIELDPIPACPCCNKTMI